MNVSIVKHAGFCFGVDRAVKIVYNEIDVANHGNYSIATFGPIIHNPDVVDDLNSRGVRIVNKISDLKPNEIVIIRSHGVSNTVYEEISKQGNKYIDATCPFVTKIHNIVEEKSKAGYTIFIAGDKTHAEVEGIVGHCMHSTAYVFSNVDELLELLNTIEDGSKVAIVSQTTFNTNVWKECCSVLKGYADCEVFNTICNATSSRQFESIELAKRSDVMIIVGGKNSSNTKKLYTVCNQHCKHCIHIENASELEGIDFGNVQNIGITAGASTPAYIIKEVQVHMENLKNSIENNEVEDFGTLLDQSFKKIHTKEKVTAKVVKVEDNEIIVDLGTKHTGYVSLADLTDDPKLKPSDIVKVDDEIELIVLKVNDADGVAYLSRKEVDKVDGFNKVVKVYEDDAVIEGTIVSVVNGGVIATYSGVRVFIPVSLVGVPKGEDLNNLLKQKIKFKIIEVNEGRKRAVGSVKAVKKAEKEAAALKFWETVQVGDVFQGEVKSITSYGAFVDLGGIDGMVHISELSWKRIKHPKEVVSVGDTIEVFVKDMDKESGRISLGHKKEEDNPWTKFMNEYKVGDVTTATIVSITQFGAFAKIIDGVDGLIHVSQISNERVEDVKSVLSIGQEVKVKITEINEEKKRISISMKQAIDVD
ncbi:MAG: bifunctional 4-hydroxy-3-methylbut-2-enyl diphosphate reductase/30S ribosomal protein S1 [Ruminococcus sp.]|nr:bifunctional 4-hydroxy-3-methylbut-2-enyl diphosphate reductase/30S ribosomal protein S1 [Ruminococcus sp.]